MHPNLRTFLDLLRRENSLITVEVEVDPYLELAEIHRRVIEQSGPALLFTRVKGSRYPVVTNLFGTARRIEQAFGPKPLSLVKQMAEIAELLLPPRPRELWQHKSLARDILKLGTKNVRSGPITDVIDRPAKLNELPVLTTWQEDGGPFITLPLVYTEHPTPASTISASIACRFTTSKRPGFTGRFKRAAAFTITKPRGWASHCR